MHRHTIDPMKFQNVYVFPCSDKNSVRNPMAKFEFLRKRDRAPANDARSDCSTAVTCRACISQAEKVSSPPNFVRAFLKKIRRRVRGSCAGNDPSLRAPAGQMLCLLLQGGRCSNCGARSHQYTMVSSFENRTHKCVWNTTKKASFAPKQVVSDMQLGETTEF